MNNKLHYHQLQQKYDDALQTIAILGMELKAANEDLDNVYELINRLNACLDEHDIPIPR
jgi:FtsZ-binding cell division protein ZapB